MIDDNMRRTNFNTQTQAERQIGVAMAQVEDAGADPILTEAVELLTQAQNRVADFVDGLADVRLDFPAAVDGLSKGGQWARHGWPNSARLMQENGETILVVSGVRGFKGQVSDADKAATDWYQAG